MRMSGLLCAGLMLGSVLYADTGMVVNITRVESPPLIDGKLDDAAWKNATILEPFIRVDTNQNAKTPTIGRLCYDSNAFYVAIECTEPHTEQLKAEAKEKDGPVSRDDCVEIFIQPGSLKGEYYHFLVNSRNVGHDQRVWRDPLHPAETIKDNSWDGDWRSAVAIVTGRSWIVEMAIPWHNFALDIGAGTWAFNICRNKSTDPRESSSYSYSGGKYHDPARFAQMTKPDIDCASLGSLKIYEVAVNNCRLGDEGLAYVIEGFVVNQAATNRAVVLEFYDLPDSGKLRMAGKGLDIGASTSALFQITMPAGKPGPCALKARVLEGNPPRPVFVNGYATLFPEIMTAYLDRSYYTVEDKARAIFQMKLDELPPGLVARLEIEPVGSDKISRETKIKDAAKTVVEYSLKNISNGKHPVTLSVIDREGRVVAAKSVELRREPPAPAGVRETKVDHERMCALRDGKPLFPVGIYGVPTNYLAEVAAAGFNTVIRWGGVGGNQALAKATNEDAKRKILTDYLDLAQAQGLVVIENPFQFMPQVFEGGYLEPVFAKTMREFAAETLPYIMNVSGNHPAVIAYYGPDEPPHTTWARSACAEHSANVRKGDHYHLHFYLFNETGGTEVVPWPEVYDVAGNDCYSIATGASLIEVYAKARDNGGVAHSLRRPYWHVPVCEVYGSSMCSGAGRLISGDMQRAQGYLSIIGGANGIMWWMWPARWKDNWAALKQLAGEFRELAPVLTEEAPAHEIIYEPEKEATVRTLLKTHAGKTYLICCNAAPGPVTARFGLPPGTAKKARVLFESRDVAVKDGRFQESFESYERHVYELNCKWPSNGRLDLGVDINVPTNAPVNPASNLVVDGGFEQPDAWRIRSYSNTAQDVEAACLESQPYQGVKCGVLTRARGMNGSVQLVGREIELESNTRYEFGGYVKQEGGGLATILLWRKPREDKGYMAQASMIYTIGNLGWQHYRREFVTGPERVKVMPMCMYRDGIGTAFFDGLYARKLPGAQPGQAPVPVRKNIVKNPSFERDVPGGFTGWPANWMPFDGYLPSGFVGDPAGIWAVDTNQFYAGKRSLRVTGTQAMIYGPYAPLPPGDYVVSAWIKSDQEGAQCFVQMYDLPGGKNRWTIGRDWKRYEFHFILHNSGDFQLKLFPLMGARIWLDAVQLEPGSVATEFEDENP